MSSSGRAKGERCVRGATIGADLLSLETGKLGLRLDKLGRIGDDSLNRTSYDTGSQGRPERFFRGRSHRETRRRGQCRTWLTVDSSNELTDA
jgi:hypothetical protein